MTPGLPAGLTEEQFLEATERAIAKLAPTYVFGFYTLDDIQQFCREKAWEVVAQGKFDPKRGALAGFLYKRIKNCLINLHRNKWRRPDYSCKFCKENRGAGRLCGGDHCVREREWRNTNASKMALNRPLDIDGVCDDGERSMRAPSFIAEEAQYREMMELIDEELPAELRADYLRLKDGHGESVSAERKAKVEQELRRILKVGRDAEEV